MVAYNVLVVAYNVLIVTDNVLLSLDFSRRLTLVALAVHGILKIMKLCMG